MAFGDTIMIMIKTPLLLLQQRPCCQGARVCLWTSGNRTQKCKQGSEVRVATGLDPGRGARILPFSPWSTYQQGPQGTLSPVTLDSRSKTRAPPAFNCPRPPGPRDPTSQRTWRRRVSRPRSELGSERARHGSEARLGDAPAAGRALGQGSSRPGPAHGARNREPRRAKAKVSGFPPRAGPKPPSWPPAPLHAPRRALGPRRWAPFWQGVPLPTALLPAHSRTPRLTLSGVQAARGTQQQRGHRHQQRRGRRPPPSPGAHGCWSAGSRRIRARGAGPRGSCSEAAARAALGDARPSLPRRRPAGRSPRPGGPFRQPQEGARGLGRYKSIRRRRGAGGPDPGPLRPGPRPAISRPGAPRCAPAARLSARSALGHDLRTLRQTDARTDRRADWRAGTWAGEWRAGGGSEGCSARKQRGPSAGPRAGRGKRRRGSRLGRDSAPRRGPGRGGGRTARGRRRPAPPVSLPTPGPELEAPGAPWPRGRPRHPATRVSEFGGAPHARPIETDPFLNVFAISFPWTLAGSF